VRTLSKKLILVSLLAAGAAFTSPHAALAAQAAPVANNDSYNAVAGTTFSVAAPGVLANDASVPANPVVQWQTQPPQGFTLNSNGSISYVIPAHASGAQSFTYCLLDQAGSPNAQCISNKATVTVTVAAPVAKNDSYSVIAGTTFTVPAPGVLGNDENLAPNASVHWQSPPPQGFTLNDNGSVTYVVPVDATGTASFTYCVLDLPGSPQAQCVSNKATVTLTITGPQAVDDTYEVTPGTTFTVPAPGVLGNDLNTGTNAIVHWQTSPPAGFTLNDDGSVSYVVPADATGSSFTYCVLDLANSPQAKCISNKATVTINIANPAPSVTPAGGPSLPQTGAPVGLYFGLGLILLVIGLAAVYFTRRRVSA
jgi:LPXTG-motif cell wall-anchored protein